MSKYNEQSALKALSIKKDLRIEKREIKVLSRKTKQPKEDDLGNGSWGAIDYLCNHEYYRQIFVKDF